MKKNVTIILPISRSDYLHQVFAYLELMDCDNSRTNIITIVDGDSDLYVDARNRTELSKFNSRLCVQYQPTSEFSTFDISQRRLRIADIHNQLKQYIGDCDYIFGVEDDTLIPKNALTYFLQDLSLYPHAGFIEGVELGRWGTLYVGGWKANDVYKTMRISSVMPPQNMNLLGEIDAGGFYCFITRRETYMDHIFQTYQNNSLGPDVEFGMSLRQSGFMNYIDWRISCSHRTGDETISYPKYTPQEVQFDKVNDLWSYEIVQ